jgi:CHAD domain-containing protein
MAMAGSAEGLVRSGDFALELIQRQVRRLGKLQGEVMADRDPEPLHQLRVTLRRLRTALGQFAPALVLPEGVNGRRIASVARRTSLCRDLDVLRLRLREECLPRLPEEERRSLEGALKRLGEDREQAFATLVEALRGARYLKLLARLHKWQRQPRLTRLGEMPLVEWLHEWQAPFTAGLFPHAGWMEEDPGAEALHDLRKRIKRARYALEPLEPWCEPVLREWIEELKRAQNHLGELHDLQILNRSLVEGEWWRKAPKLPALRRELEARREAHWVHWRELAERLRGPERRHEIQRRLVELGRGGQ